MEASFPDDLFFSPTSMSSGHISKPRLSKNDIRWKWLEEEGTELMKTIQASDFQQTSHMLLIGMGKLLEKECDWVLFFRTTHQLEKTFGKSNKILKETHLRWLQAISPTMKTDHDAKRKFVLNLGINQKPYTVKNAILSGCSTFDHPSGGVIHLINRPIIPSSIPRKTTLVDIFDPQHPDRHVINAQNGFLIFDAAESVLVFSGDPKKFEYRNVEFMAFRNMAKSPPPPRTPGATASTVSSHLLYKYMQDVIKYACDVRRNVRPNHEGHMAQLSLTQGARHIPAHARHLQYGVSYTDRTLSDEMKVEHDEDIVGISGIVWDLICGAFPQEIIQPVMEALSFAEIPHMASAWVAAGKGYKLKIGDKQYIFENASRAPPEIYLTQGYSAWCHTDACYAPWAFNLTVAREQLDTSTARSNVPIPTHGGANFVDLDLCIAMVNAPGTGFAFKPEHKHGTTVTGGTTNFNLTFAFSKRIADAWAELTTYQRAFFGDCGWGAGEGNLDQEKQ